MTIDYEDACNRDKIARNDFRALVERYQVQTIVETGTFHGVTTAYLASFGLPVHSIESNHDYYVMAMENLHNLTNVILYLGDSPVQLAHILPTLARPIFFFLDAHWYDCCPLQAELKTIATHCPDQAVIAIHDFKVPGKDFGYDRYKGRDYDLDYIQDRLPLVFPGGYKLWYNEEAEGARRGIIYLAAGFLDPLIPYLAPRPAGLPV